MVLKALIIPKIRIKVKSPTDVTFVDRSEYATQVEANNSKKFKLSAKDEKESKK